MNTSLPRTAPCNAPTSCASLWRWRRENSDDEDEPAQRKAYPEWAAGALLQQALRAQRGRDPDVIFRAKQFTCTLDEVRWDCSVNIFNAKFVYIVVCVGCLAPACLISLHGHHSILESWESHALNDKLKPAVMSLCPQVFDWQEGLKNLPPAKAANKRDFKRRGSSGNWLEDRVTWKEEMAYKRAMGFA